MIDVKNLKRAKTGFKRGFRQGLKASAQLVKRFMNYHEDDEKIRPILSAIAGEIPSIGMIFSNLKEDQDLKEEGEEEL